MSTNLSSNNLNNNNNNNNNNNKAQKLSQPQWSQIFLEIHFQKDIASVPRPRPWLLGELLPWRTVEGFMRVPRS